MTLSENNNKYFLLPVKDLVIFPKSITTVLIGRKKSLNLLNNISKSKNKLIFVVTQKNNFGNDITENNLNSVGVLCKVLQQTEIQNNQKRIIIEGVKTAKLSSFYEDEECYFSQVEEIKSVKNTKLQEKTIEDLKKILMNKLKECFEISGKNTDEIFITLEFFKTIDEIIFYSSALLSLDTEKKQELLEKNKDIDKLKRFLEFIEEELLVLKIDKKLNTEVEKKFLKNQKKAYLNEKVKIIKKELGEDFDESDEGDEIGLLRKRINKAKLSKEAKTKCQDEIKKMRGMLSYSSEYQVIKNYIELVLSLPWNKKTKIENNLEKAEEVLNKDHYGLDKVKERILEFLAVYKRKNGLSGQIICLVGAPGVGKTSLAKSIAEALNREYVKISLGGVRDESEIRGHRRTYVGSMPGKIINALKKIGTNNPLILLDEIDKMGMDFRGDPASALLEVLDPEQNKKFEDHYLDLEFDLSNVMFITTANNISNIPIPLRDRMEIIRISGYTEEEKLNIAKKHLIPQEIEKHGLKKKEFSIDDKSIIEVIRKYTFEAGVRNLKREFAQIIRKVTKEIVIDNKINKIAIKAKNLKDYLGVEKFDYNKVSKHDKIGVAVGLAYTDFGGDLLNIESLKFSGTGKLITTGKLGDVMKESAQAAFSYVRSVADNFKIKPKEFNSYDFHLHVPEGATPKDGPSAGVAITASLLSSMTGMKINKDVAMTGEISLTGQVLPIGGLKEKLLAALRGNIKTVIIPKANEKNLADIPENVKKGLKIVPVDNLDDALKIIIKGYKL